MLRTVFYQTVSLVCEINYELSESNPAIISSDLEYIMTLSSLVLHFSLSNGAGS